MRHHRQQVGLRLLIHTLLPEPREIARAFQQFLLALLLGGDDAVRSRQRRRDVGPARQLAAVLPGEVEQHRQHLRGQLDRDRIDEIEHLVDRQIVETARRALADVDRKLVEIGRREHRRHGLALRGVARLVHGDETLASEVRRNVADGDAAERRRRREHLMVGVDRHDVVVARHRPVRAEHRVLAVVDRVFLAQAVEIRPVRVGAEQLGMAGIELGKRQRISALARGVLAGPGVQIDRSVHERLPSCPSRIGSGGRPCWRELQPVGNAPARASLALLAALHRGCFRTRYGTVSFLVTSASPRVMACLELALSRRRPRP